MRWAADVTDVEFRTVGLLECWARSGWSYRAHWASRRFSPPLAAAGLALTMIGGIVTHVRMGETDRLAVPIVLLALTLFVALERFGAHSLG